MIRKGSVYPACSEVMAEIMLLHTEKEMSPPLMMNLLFLSDWRHTLRTGQPLTGVPWLLDTYGPYAKEMYEVLESDPQWEITSVVSPYGMPKNVIRFRPNRPRNSLPGTGRSVINGLMKEIRVFSYTQVLDLVSKATPVKNGQSGSYIEFNPFLSDQQT